MHNNFYFLRQISVKLHAELTGFTLVSCFSQNKDEIVFEFNNAKRSIFIRADLQSEFSCLTFPEVFHRARKNSIDLFGEVILKKVVGVIQYKNERAFAIRLEDGLDVLFKMHGNRSNVLLIQNEVAVSSFKKKLDNSLVYDKEIDFSKDAFVTNSEQPEKLYFTFGKPVWNYLKWKGFNEFDLEKKWELICDTLQKLENPDRYWINEEGSVTHLTLLEYGHIIREHSNPFEALNDFASTYMSRTQLRKKTEHVVAAARQEIKITQRNLDEANARLFEIQEEDTFKIWADLLMANLHLVPTGTKSVTLTSFYDGNPVSISLDEKLSAQKNAERYYRKSKNRTIEIEKLKESISNLNARLQRAQQKLSDPQIEEETVAASEKEKPPFWQFEYKGFVIFVGKDAKNNDELTMRWANKNDLWLHARDVAGSHVIIRYQAGKPFPKDVIEYAASIAAFNSKRKTETLAPVIVTTRKFVRKKKGTPAGAVIVEREEVILVEPKNPTSQH